MFLLGVGGGQGYFRLAMGGLNFFVKKFRGVSQLIARYIQDRGSLAKMGRAVKQ